jgi:DNA helicase HerA-like ATPase
MKIKPNERVAIVGKTGSGKSYFARALLSGARRLIVCDAKGTLDAKSGWNLTHKWKDGYKELAGGKNARVRVLAPRTVDEWEQYFDDIYKLRDVIVYIDEMYGVGPASGSPGLKALYTRGRELGIGVWACSQRPKHVPLYMFSEAEWVIQFQLRLATDIERMVDIMGPIAEYKLVDHNFIVFNDRIDNPKIYGKLTVR